MIPAYQLVTDPGKGDCIRACIASMLELPCSEVPNFMDDKNSEWFAQMWKFLQLHGYEYTGHDKFPFEHVKKSEGINGYFMVSVPSINYANIKTDDGKIVTHAVVFKGTEFAHDPSVGKTKQWSIEDVRYFYIIEKVKKG